MNSMKFNSIKNRFFNVKYGLVDVRLYVAFFPFKKYQIKASLASQTFNQQFKFTSCSDSFVLCNPNIHSNLRWINFST